MAPSSWLYSVQKNRQGVEVSATFATVIAVPPVTALISFSAASKTSMPVRSTSSPSLSSRPACSHTSLL